MADKRRRWANVLCLLLLIGCGPAELGEECDEAGSTDDCEDGAICTNGSGDEEAVCRLLCVEQLQCPAGTTCNGISGTNLKSCQPD